MSLAWMETFNFRNLAGSRMSFSEPVTLFYGRNAQGKTSILEAIYLLGTTRSFREKKVVNLLKIGENEGAIRGEVARDGSTSGMEIRFTANRRRFAKNGNDCELGDYLQTMPVVSLSSEDAAVVKGEPQARRTYVDATAALLQKSHIGTLREFTVALKNRNEIIRNYSTSKKFELEAWTRVFCTSAEIVSEARARVIQRTRETLKELAKELRSTETVNIIFKPSRCGHLLDDFDASLATDLRRGATHAGPHRDDVEIMVGGKSLAVFGSSGQIRAALWMLKLARVVLVGRERGQEVVFLLDDVETHLDAPRLGNLMSLTGGRAQVFMTSTEPLVEDKISMRRYLVTDGAAVA